MKVVDESVMNREGMRTNVRGASRRTVRIVLSFYMRIRLFDISDGRLGRLAA